MAAIRITVVGFKAVHLDQQLVEGLLALVVSAAEACATVTADSVDLINEDDAGRVLLALFEQVANTRCADADEHLHEVGTGDREERDVGFASDCAREEGLAGARRSDEQDALGDAAAKTLELLGLAEELDDLLELFLGFVDAGDILERDLLLLHGEQAGTRLAEGHGLIPAGLHLAHHEHEEAEQQQDGQGGNRGVEPEAGGLVLDVDGDAMFAQILVKLLIVQRGKAGGDVDVVRLLRPLVVGCDLGSAGSNILHLAGFDVALELRVGRRLVLTRAGRLGDVVPKDEERRDERSPEKELFDRRVQSNFLVYNQPAMEMLGFALGEVARRCHL